MSDPKALYQEVILDHNRKPRNYGALADANRKAEGHNPLCGDHITLALRLDGDRVGAIAFEGESCAICKASASMLTTNVKGRTTAEAETLIREFREIVREPLPNPNDPRFKKWDVHERFPWGWGIVQQQLHERLARR